MMQLAGVEGEQVFFLLEDHQVIDSAFLDMVNSLLSSGEVLLFNFAMQFHI
jgi:hypothetical protein